MLKLLISGGQSGIDQLGLQVAKELGIPTGGMMPKGFITDEGNRPEFVKEYNMIESKSEGYPIRTEWNVQNSDGTLIFGNVKSAGTKLTLKCIRKYDKPHLVNPISSDSLLNWMSRNNIETLNVAGNRASKLTDNQIANYRIILTNALKSNQNETL